MGRGSAIHAEFSWVERALRIPFLSRSTTGLNSEFSLSLTSCHTKVKEPSLSIVRRENSWIHTVFKGNSAMWNSNSLVQVWTHIVNFLFVTARVERQLLLKVEKQTSQKKQILLNNCSQIYPCLFVTSGVENYSVT